MTPDDTLSTTARATAACAGPNIWTACVAFFMVTLLKSSVSGLAGRLGVTTASSLVKPSVLFDNVLTNACPAWPDFDPMIRSMWATSFPSPTSDSPMKKSAAITTSRSGWGARNPAAGVTNAALRAAWLRGSEEPRGPAFAEPLRRGAQRRGEAPLREVVLHQAEPEVIAGALRQHLPAHQPGRRRHPARQEAQPQAQPRLVERGGADPAEERVELADAPILSARIAEVLPRLEPRGHGLRRGDRRAFVDQQLPQAGAAPRVPVVVMAAQVGDQPPQVGPAGGRRVSHGVRRFVRHPQRQ